MKRALVTGVLGQDGAYLTRLLLKQGLSCLRDVSPYEFV